MGLSDREGTQQFADIQALRGVAILLVLVQHVQITAWLLGLSRLSITLPFYIGVELFFVISGFVIVHSLIRHDFDVRGFFIKRVFRLTPGVLVAFAIAFIVRLVFTLQALPPELVSRYEPPLHKFAQEGLSIAGGYFLLTLNHPNYYAGGMWSLSVEDQFYVATGLALVVLNAVARRRERVTGGLTAIAAFVTVSCLVVRLVCLVEPHWLGFFPATLRFIAGWRFDCPAVGVLLGIAYEKRRWPFHVDPGRLRPLDSVWWLLAALVALAMMGPPNVSVDRGGLVHGLGYPLATLCFLFLVRNAACGRAFAKRGAWWYRFLTYMGDRSYTYYLLEFPIFALVFLATFTFARAAATNGAVYVWVELVISVAALGAVAQAVYARVERPLTALGRRLAHAGSRERGSPVLKPADEALGLRTNT
ncbi:MAG: acyltransferase [Fimbriimonas ginsengisoli]|uniref:Acyltransferase n=1 Tax=Fimbriimonas ginsengisoli TaxID=1005039 RepID=A0A931LRY4_FIMGI|nr:acyltransferase [Fimbriimonas ginsengisoli]